MVEVDTTLRLKRLEDEISSLKRDMQISDDVRNSLFSLIIAELSHLSIQPESTGKL